METRYLQVGEVARCKECGERTPVPEVDDVTGPEDENLPRRSEPEQRAASKGRYAPRTLLARQWTDAKLYPVEFHGTGSEYFRIWIVNMALTVVTLGVYSAWAKVRTRRYFYGNTRVDGSAFEYLARPIAILKGRIVAVVVLALVVFTNQTLPLVYVGLVLLLFLVAPWVILRAMRFNARVSAFRNVRFDFDETLGKAYRVFVGLPLFALMTFGVAFPLLRARMLSFFFSGHRYGGLGAEDELSAGAVFKLYLMAAALALGAFLVMVATSTLILMLFAEDAFSGTSEVEEDAPLSPEQFAWMIPAYLMMGVSFLGIRCFLEARLRNALLNDGAVGGRIRFSSELEGRELLRIRLWYGLLTLVTLGFAYPWLQVKLAQYRADCTTIFVSEPLDTIVEEAAPAGSAAGDQVAELFDVDFGI